jgi:hypothetical protein
MQRRVIRSVSGGSPLAFTGLIYYQIGDTEKFAGKELTLKSFVKGKTLWKDNKNRSFNVIISKKNGPYAYLLKKAKP